MRPASSKSLRRPQNGMFVIAFAVALTAASAALGLPTTRVALAQQVVPNPQVERNLAEVHAGEVRLDNEVANAERSITATAGLAGGVEEVNRAISGTQSPAVSPSLIQRGINGVVAAYNWVSGKIAAGLSWLNQLLTGESAQNLSPAEREYFLTARGELERAQASADATAERGVANVNAAAAAANATAARTAASGGSGANASLPGLPASSSSSGVDELGPAASLPGAGTGSLSDMTPPGGAGAVPDQSDVTGLPNPNQNRPSNGTALPDLTLPGLSEAAPGANSAGPAGGPIPGSGSSGATPDQSDITGNTSPNQGSTGSGSSLPDLPAPDGTQFDPFANPAGGSTVPGSGSSSPTGFEAPPVGGGMGSLPGLPPPSAPGGQASGLPGSADPFAGSGAPGSGAPGSGFGGGAPGSGFGGGAPGSGFGGGAPGSGFGGGTPGSGFGGGDMGLPGLPGALPPPPNVGGGFPDQTQPGTNVDPLTGLPSGPGQFPGSGNTAPLPGLEFPGVGPGSGSGGGASVPGSGTGSSGPDPLANLPVPSQNTAGLPGLGDSSGGVAVPGTGGGGASQASGTDSPGLSTGPGGGARSSGLGGATPGGGAIQFPRPGAGAGGGGGGQATRPNRSVGADAASPGSRDVRGPRRRLAAVVAPRGPRSMPVDRDGFDPDVVRLTGKIVVLRAGRSLPDVSQLSPGEAVLARVAAVDALLENKDMVVAVNRAVGRHVPLLAAERSAEEPGDPDLRDFAPDFLDDSDDEDWKGAEKTGAEILDPDAGAPELDQPSIEVWLVADWDHYSKSRYRVSIMASEPAKLELNEGASVTVRGLVRRERLPEGVRRRVLGDIAEVEVQTVMAILEEEAGQESRD